MQISHDAPLTQNEILVTLSTATHSLWKLSFVETVNTAFGVSLKCRDYSRDIDSGPKGLTLNEKAENAIGLASFDMATMLCSALNVRYESFIGRGFQTRACVDALRKAGYGKD